MSIQEIYDQLAEGLCRYTKKIETAKRKITCLKWTIKTQENGVRCA